MGIESGKEEEWDKGFRMNILQLLHAKLSPLMGKLQQENLPEEIGFDSCMKL